MDEMENRPEQMEWPAEALGVLQDMNEGLMGGDSGAEEPVENMEPLFHEYEPMYINHGGICYDGMYDGR